MLGQAKIKPHIVCFGGRAARAGALSYIVYSILIGQTKACAAFIYVSERRTLHKRARANAMRAAIESMNNKIHQQFFPLFYKK